MGKGQLFIESSSFSKNMNAYFGSDELYAEFQSNLAVNPELGSVIPGAAPLRKVRWRDNRRGEGKRGGIRVIYIHLPDLQSIYLLDVYGKDELDDLSSDDKKALKSLAQQLVSELRMRHSRGGK